MSPEQRASVGATDIASEVGTSMQKWAGHWFVHIICLQPRRRCSLKAEPKASQSNEELSTHPCFLPHESGLPILALALPFTAMALGQVTSLPWASVSSRIKWRE